MSTEREHLEDYIFFLCFSLILQSQYGCMLLSAITWVKEELFIDIKSPAVNNLSFTVIFENSMYYCFSINNHHPKELFTDVVQIRSS